MHTKQIPQKTLITNSLIFVTWLDLVKVLSVLSNQEVNNIYNVQSWDYVSSHQEIRILGRQGEEPTQTYGHTPFLLSQCRPLKTKTSFILGSVCPQLKDAPLQS